MSCGWSKTPTLFRSLDRAPPPAVPAPPYGNCDGPRAPLGHSAHGFSSAPPAVPPLESRYSSGRGSRSTLLAGSTPQTSGNRYTHDRRPRSCRLPSVVGALLLDPFSWLLRSL